MENFVESRNTMMMEAIRAGDLAAVNAMLALGINLKDINALEHAPASLIDILILHGAEMEMRNSSGETPLISAINTYKSIGVQKIKHLLAHGAKTENIWDTLWKTCTVDALQPNLMRVLAHFGIETNPMVMEGTSLLDHAITRERALMLQGYPQHSSPPLGIPMGRSRGRAS